MYKNVFKKPQGYGIIRNMRRRKLFWSVLCLLSLLYLLDLAGIPLAPAPAAALTESARDYTGTVRQIREKEENVYTMRVRLHTADGQKLDRQEDVLLTYYSSIEEPWRLQRAKLRFRCSLAAPASAGNPHCFDYADYLKSCGIRLIGTLTSFTITDGSESGGGTAAIFLPASVLQDLFGAYERLLVRQKFRFAALLHPQSRGLLMGVLFGETAYLDDEITQQFRDNGTAHILAVSGLHIGILYDLYRRLTRNRSSAPALAALGLLLFSYGTLSAWSPSTVRAVLMIGLSVAARLLDLRYDMLTALSAAALLLIARNPYVILGTAFQMSFLAISSIAFFQRILPQKVPGSLTTALAVNLGLILYQAYQFHTISLISLAANLPILYLTGYFVPFAMGCFALSGCAGGSLFSLCLSFLEAMAQMMLRINAWFGLSGHAAIEVVRPPIWLTILLLGGAFFAASETCLLLRLRKQNKQLAGRVGLILLMALAVQLLTYSPITHDDLIFVDVGQGDAIHLRSHGSQILIDGGGNVRYDVGSKTLKPYFLGNGVRKLDLALATHRHTDHYLGQCQLAETFPVKQQLAGLTAGKEIRLGKNDQVWIEVLWPLTLDEDPQQEGNAACSVFLLHYDGYRILVTGDLDEEGELAMLAYYQSIGQTGTLRADVLKIGHHGSRTSSAAEFLDAVDPRIAVIQVGKNNYGHPSPEVLARLAERGIRVFRNDLDGAVGLKFRGQKGIRVDTMRTKTRN